MDALRAYVQQTTNVLTLSLPDAWVGRRLEVLVLPANDREEPDAPQRSVWEAWAQNGPQGPMDSADGFPE